MAELFDRDIKTIGKHIYAVDQQIQIKQLTELKHTIKILSHITEQKELTQNEANGLLKVILDYTYGLDILDKYDFQQLQIEATTPSTPFHATYEKAIEAILPT